MDELQFFLWLGFRYVFITLLLLYLVFGIDDILVDTIFYARAAYRWIFRRKLVKPVTLSQLRSIPEKPIAIMIPAWDESPVIARMLLNTAGTLDYRHYHIFVGTYSNDEKTQHEVESIQEVYGHVHVAKVGHPGPTNKADCLNAILNQIFIFERESHIHFEGFVLHDSEDVVHPQSLHYYNHLLPRMQFIQIPVFPLPCKPWQLVGGTYMDEFAENHTKNLRVRELVGHALPSAGVGTAFSREAITYLKEQGGPDVFEGDSVTEDYQVGLKLEHLKGPKIFLQQTVGRAAAASDNGDNPKRLREPLATREIFPNSLRNSVRQKSRWIIGIAFQGWRQGWTRSAGDNYFLYRDRKSVLANMAVMMGYVVVSYVFINWSCGMMGVSAAPSLLASNEWYLGLVKVVLGMFVWRIANRIHASWQIYGPVHGLLALPRVVVANILNFLATCRAIGIYTKARITRQPLAWCKTSHSFPSDVELRSYHRRLGDVLLDYRLITPETLQSAIDDQKISGKKLGEILVERGDLWEEDLVSSLAEQQHYPFIEIDPYHIPPEVIALVSSELAKQHRVFPIEVRDAVLVIATDKNAPEAIGTNWEELLGQPVHVKLCAKPDMEHALLHAYDLRDLSTPPPDHEHGERLLKKGYITEEELNNALRDKKRREGDTLETILIRMGALTQAQLDLEMEA